MVITAAKKATHYNDPNFNYADYWEGRSYENGAELLAIDKFLKDKHFKVAVDVGGGYGRLSKALTKYADKVILAEPSKQQLELAEQFLKDYPKIDRQLLQANSLKFPKGSVDLVTMVRVMHHLPDPSIEFKEIHRILNDDGYFVLEVANYGHARNRLRYFITNKPLPTEPVDIRSAKNKKKDAIAFVNHNPKTVIKQLAHAGFKVERTLSVSNLRSTLLKRFMPRPSMLMIENILQVPLTKTYFGPSIFFLVKKAQ